MSMQDHRWISSSYGLSWQLMALTFFATYISVANVPIAIATTLKPTNITLNIFSIHLWLQRINAQLNINIVVICS
jgi:hypothetical protein